MFVWQENRARTRPISTNTRLWVATPRKEPGRRHQHSTPPLSSPLFQLCVFLFDEACWASSVSMETVVVVVEGGWGGGGLGFIHQPFGAAPTNVTTVGVSAAAGETCCDCQQAEQGEPSRWIGEVGVGGLAASPLTTRVFFIPVGSSMLTVADTVATHNVMSCNNKTAPPPGVKRSPAGCRRYCSGGSRRYCSGGSSSRSTGTKRARLLSVLSKH